MTLHVLQCTEQLPIRKNSLDQNVTGAEVEKSKLEGVRVGGSGEALDQTKLGRYPKKRPRETFRRSLAGSSTF